MSQYYLMAQLPSLDALAETAPLPITEARFAELCGRLLREKMVDVLKKLSLVPPKNGERVGSAVVDGWNAAERQLRMALAVARAEKMNKTFDAEPTVFPQPLMQVCRAAIEMEDPLAAEKYLYQYRLNILETLRPMDAFSDDMVFYYGLKLKLIARMRAFDPEKGEGAYREMYRSILQGDVQEATT